MYTPSAISRQSRKVSGDQQRLNERETQRDNPCESGKYVERAAPCEQRARRCKGDRHANGCCEGGPGQGRLSQSHPFISDSVRRAEERSAPRGSYLLRFASRDAERRF